VKRKLLIVDTETSGLDPQKNCILSLAAVVYHDGAIEDAVQWPVMDALEEFDPAALAVNGFTHERVLADGISPWGVIRRLEQLLLKHDMRGRVVLAGHNLPFDVGFLQRLYRLANEDYGKQFMHGGLDTKVAALLLEQAGRLRFDSPSLVDVAAALGIKHNTAHDALEDALVTAQVLRRLVDRIHVAG
jgi:DNA polymerase-3 subunit epsilon